MSDTLRSKLIRLAHQNPKLRADILPLLAAAPKAKKSASVALKPLAAKMTLVLEGVKNISVKWSVDKSHPYPDGHEVRNGKAQLKGKMVVDPAGSFSPIVIPFDSVVTIMESNSGYVGVFLPTADRTTLTGKLLGEIMNGYEFSNAMFDMMGTIPSSPEHAEWSKEHGYPA